MLSVQLLPSASTSTQATKEIAQPGVLALAFSPLSTYLFTFERPVKSETDVHRNVKAWSVESGEEVGGWHQKSYDDWSVTRSRPSLIILTDDVGSPSLPQTSLTFSARLHLIS